jgi:hypothetical protein
MATGASRKIDITALGPAAVDTVLWQMAGRLHVTVVAKASFSFEPDAAMSRIDPEEILRAEVHHNKNPMRSVRFTGDLAPFQPLCDVVLTGHACAPAGTTVDALSVRLVVFREVPLIDKTLYVRGDTQGTETTPFDRIPLMYERAFGGIGWEDNPLGVGAGAATSAKTPNVIDPEEPKRVAGFAPISRGWPLRKRLLGAADRKALDRPIADVPAGFDWAYYQSAPLDQRAEYLQGSEWIILDGMNPAHAHIQSYLPGARAFARVYGVADGGSGHLLTLSADTLRIDADALTCSVTWRASFPVQAEEALAALRIIAGVESAGHPLDWPALPAPKPPSIPPPPLDRPTEVLSLGAILPPQGASTMMLEDVPDLPRAPSASASMARAPLPVTVEIIETPAEPAEAPADIGEVSVEIIEVIEDVTDLARSFDSVEIVEEPSVASKWAGTVTIAPEDEDAAARAPAVPFLSAEQQVSSSQQAPPATMRLPPLIEDAQATASFVSTLFIEDQSEDQEDRTLRRSLPFSQPVAPRLPPPAPPAVPAAAPVGAETPAPVPLPVADPIREPIAEPVTESAASAQGDPGAAVAPHESRPEIAPDAAPLRTALPEDQAAFLDEGEPIGLDRSIEIESKSKSKSESKAASDHVEAAFRAPALAVARTEEVGGDGFESVAEARSLGADHDHAIDATAGTSAAVGASQSTDFALEKTLIVGERLTIVCGEARITIEKSGLVTIEGKDLNVKATGDVKVEATGKVEVKSTGDVKVEATGKVEVKGSGPMELNASGPVKVKGANVGIN